MAAEQKTDEQKAAEAAEVAAKADAKEAAAEKAAKAKAGKRGETIAVRGPQGGRMRAGRRFGPEEIEIDLSTLTASELAAIQADPLLTVRRADG